MKRSEEVVDLTCVSGAHLKRRSPEHGSCCCIIHTPYISSKTHAVGLGESVILTVWGDVREIYVHKHLGK